MADKITSIRGLAAKKEQFSEMSSEAQTIAFNRVAKTDKDFQALTPEVRDQVRIKLLGSGVTTGGKERTLKQDIPGIIAEFVSGALADAPKDIERNPLKFATSGLPGVSLASGANAGVEVADFVGNKDRPAPFPAEQRQLNILPQPQTDAGKQIGLAANLLGGLVGAPGKTFFKTVDKTAKLIQSNVVGANKVKRIQQAFPGFRRKETQKFGRAIKEGLAELGESPNIALKENQAIFSPITNAIGDATIPLPRAAKAAAKSAKNLDINGLLRKKAMVKRSMSVAERTGKLTTERSRVLNETIGNIDKTILSKVPGIEDANAQYAMFVRIRKLMQETFESAFGSEKLKGLPNFFGTGKGEKFLRKAADFTEEEIGLLHRFENATKINIVGTAKRAATVRKMSNMVKKLAAIGITMGALKAAGADRLFFQALDVSN